MGTESLRAKAARGIDSSHAFAAWVTGCFVAVELFNILHHEMWRDELQAWLIARGSNSVLDLARNSHYEGHPILWYLLLLAITRFTQWPAAMQLLNLAIATGATYLAARYSPFTRFQRVLLCFGYFPLYEYGTISRNYGIGLLFLFWFCAWYRPDRKQNWIIGAVLLALLANTSIYGTLIALALAGSLFALPAIITLDLRGITWRRAAQVAIAALIFCGSVALAIFQMHPPADASYTGGWHATTTARSFGETLQAVHRGFLPIPNSLAHFWNSNFLVSNAIHGRWVSIISIVILLVAVLLLVRKPFALAAYVFGTGAILAFMHLKYFGGARAFGHFFIVFIACLWIAARFPEETWVFRPFEIASRLLARQGSTILSCLLFVHFAVGATASGVDWARPFSQGKAVAAFLRSHGMEDMFMVGDLHSAVTTVTGYLGRGVYYPYTQSVDSFVIWKQRPIPPHKTLMEIGSEMAERRRSHVLVISVNPLETTGTSAREIAEFTGSIVPDEDYHLYLVDCGDCTSSSR